MEITSGLNARSYGPGMSFIHAFNHYIFAHKHNKTRVIIKENEQDGQ